MPPKEEGSVHAEIWKKEFNPETGEPKFKPFLQKYSVTEWKYFLQYPNGFVVKEIYHLPKGAQTPEQFAEAQENKAKGKA